MTDSPKSHANHATGHGRLGRVHTTRTQPLEQLILAPWHPHAPRSAQNSLLLFPVKMTSESCFSDSKLIVLLNFLVIRNIVERL